MSQSYCNHITFVSHMSQSSFLLAQLHTKGLVMPSMFYTNGTMCMNSYY